MTFNFLNSVNFKQPSVTDVLKAMKAIPQGFRSSTLGKWYQKGNIVYDLF